ncbi:MAG: RING-HC finger protein [Candidatus Endonucleobacter sp. (ex Gigantidas childressi)]|nr:RING-HC finger protein [Candidatus Endonucleobacter sp. (ex Gigantidas childressi)]
MLKLYTLILLTCFNAICAFGFGEDFNPAVVELILPATSAAPAALETTVDTQETQSTAENKNFIDTNKLATVFMGTPPPLPRLGESKKGGCSVYDVKERLKSTVLFWLQAFCVMRINRIEYAQDIKHLITKDIASMKNHHSALINIAYLAMFGDKDCKQAIMDNQKSFIRTATDIVTIINAISWFNRIKPHIKEKLPKDAGFLKCLVSTTGCTESVSMDTVATKITADFLKERHELKLSSLQKKWLGIFICQWYEQVPAKKLVTSITRFWKMDGISHFDIFKMFRIKSIFLKRNEAYRKGNLLDEKWLCIEYIDSNKNMDKVFMCAMNNKLSMTPKWNNKARHNPKKSIKTASIDTNKRLDAELKKEHDKKLQEKEALSGRSRDMYQKICKEIIDKDRNHMLEMLETALREENACVISENSEITESDLTGSLRSIASILLYMTATRVVKYKFPHLLEQIVQIEKTKTDQNDYITDRRKGLDCRCHLTSEYKLNEEHVASFLNGFENEKLVLELNKRKNTNESWPSNDEESHDVNINISKPSKMLASLGANTADGKFAEDNNKSAANKNYIINLIQKEGSTEHTLDTSKLFKLYERYSSGAGDIHGGAQKTWEPVDDFLTEFDQSIRNRCQADCSTITQDHTAKTLIALDCSPCTADKKWLQKLNAAVIHMIMQNTPNCSNVLSYDSKVRKDIADTLGGNPQPSTLLVNKLDQCCYIKEPIIDLILMLDLTSSMAQVIDAVKTQLYSIIDRVLGATSSCESVKQQADACQLWTSFIGYRDYFPTGKETDNQHVVVAPTQDSKKIHDIICKEEADGGYDIPEDIAGALKNYSKIIDQINTSRPHSTRVLVHFADAPAHGFTHPDATNDDSFPFDHRLNYRDEVLATLGEMVGLGVNYSFVFTGAQRYQNTMDMMQSEFRCAFDAGRLEDSKPVAFKWYDTFENKNTSSNDGGVDVENNIISLVNGALSSGSRPEVVLESALREENIIYDHFIVFTHSDEMSDSSQVRLITMLKEYQKKKNQSARLLLISNADNCIHQKFKRHVAGISEVHIQSPHALRDIYNFITREPLVAEVAEVAEVASLTKEITIAKTELYNPTDSKYMPRVLGLEGAIRSTMTKNTASIVGTTNEDTKPTLYTTTDGNKILRCKILTRLQSKLPDLGPVPTTSTWDFGLQYKQQRVLTDNGDYGFSLLKCDNPKSQISQTTKQVPSVSLAHIKQLKSSFFDTYGKALRKDEENKTWNRKDECMTSSWACAWLTTYLRVGYDAIVESYKCGLSIPITSLYGDIDIPIAKACDSLDGYCNMPTIKFNTLIEFTKDDRGFITDYSFPRVGIKDRGVFVDVAAMWLAPQLNHDLLANSLEEFTTVFLDKCVNNRAFDRKILKDPYGKALFPESSTDLTPIDLAPTALLPMESELAFLVIQRLKALIVHKLHHKLFVEDSSDDSAEKIIPSFYEMVRWALPLFPDNLTGMTMKSMEKIQTANKDNTTLQDLDLAEIREAVSERCDVVRQWFHIVKDFSEENAERDVECPVCFDEMDKVTVLTNCLHKLCRSCANRMKRSKSAYLCPLCRKHIELSPKGEIKLLEQ